MYTTTTTYMFKSAGTDAPKPLILTFFPSPPPAPPIQCWHLILSDLMRKPIRVRMSTLIVGGGGGMLNSDSKALVSFQ